MTSLRGLVVACCVTFSFINLVGSTKCRPLSTFKLDCNTCTCSRNGREYSCTRLICPPPNKEGFVEEIREDGRVLLRPKQRSGGFDDDDFILTRKLRHSELSDVNDEIPVSGEDNPRDEAEESSKLEPVKDADMQGDGVEYVDDVRDYDFVAKAIRDK